MNTLYYYQLADGTMDGPVELDALLRDLADGMITETTRVSRGGDDAWVELRAARLRHLGAPTMTLAKEPAAPKAAECKLPGTGLESAFQVIGMLMVGLAVFVFIGGISTGDAEMILGVGSLSAGIAVSGMLFLALAKGLLYLRGILGELRQGIGRA